MGGGTIRDARKVARMSKVCRTLLWAVIAVGTALGVSAQTFTTLANFDYTDGAYPFYVSLVQGLDGSFYGTTTQLGVGTVFKITPSGKLATIYSFSQGRGIGGDWPYSGLVLGTDGNFYGTTYYGGSLTICQNDTA